MKEEIVAAAGVVDGVAKEMISKSFALLEQLAAKIGVTVEYLWPFMVKEQITQWATSAMMFVLCAALSAFTISNIDNDVFNDSYDGNKSIVSQICFVIMGIILAIITIVAFVKVWVLMPGLLNPEYHALRNLIDMAK